MGGESSKEASASTAASGQSSIERSRAAAAAKSKQGAGGLIPASHVQLNVYEDSQGQQGMLGLNIYHTGIEISGVEYCYAGGEGAPAGSTGVCTQTPKTSPPGSQWKYVETIDLGVNKKSSIETQQLLDKLKGEFQAAHYTTMHRNCNHFSEAVAKGLGLSFPSHINRAAKFGSFFAPDPHEAARIADKKRADEAKLAGDWTKRKGNVVGGKSGASASKKDAASNAATTKYNISSAETAKFNSPPAAASAQPSTGTKSAAAAAPSKKQESGGQGKRKNPWKDDPEFVKKQLAKAEAAAAAAAAQPPQEQAAATKA